MKINIAQRFTDVWFSPAPPIRLQLIRIITGILSLWYLVTRFNLINGLSKLGKGMFEPVGLMRLFDAMPSPLTITCLLVLTILLNVLFIAGWQFKWVGPAFAILLLITFCYRNSWSMIYHNYNLLVLHIMVIGFCAAGGVPAFSNTAPREYWQFGWPLKLISMITALSYFLSAIAKLKGELAWQWLNGSAMRSQVAVDAIRKNMFGIETSTVFDELYSNTWLFTGMAVMSLLIELLAPLVVLAGRRIAGAWVLLAWLMHWGILVIMGIEFVHHLTGIVYLSFLAPEKWLHAIQSKFIKRKRLNPVTRLNPVSTY